MIRGASIIYSGQMSYYLDHLGVLCYILDIPLIVTDKKLHDLARCYYPQVRSIHRSHRELSLEALSSFDLLVVSDKFSAKTLNLLLSTLYQKKMHFLFLPHGNSDKGQVDELMSPYPLQEMCIVYGQQMHDRMKNSGHLAKIRGIIKGGNLRKIFYLMHKEYYDNLMEKELALPKEKKTFLYAPTWKDQEDSTSFFDVCERLLEQLPDRYNLVVKLHPFLEHYFPSKVCALCEKYKASNVRFLIHYPLIYPLLNLIDIYLGDFSAVGYDFLFFDRPMFFFNPKKRRDKGTHLHRCGITIPLDSYSAIFPFIEKNLSKNFSSSQSETYDYAFYPDRKFASIREEIRSVYEAIAQSGAG